jgi:hypothetical protein
MIGLIGIDCATAPERTGLARGHLDGVRVVVSEARTGDRRSDPAEVVAGWLRAFPRALIALDAPLGWPRGLSSALSEHYAGSAIDQHPTISHLRVKRVGSGRERAISV